MATTLTTDEQIVKQSRKKLQQRLFRSSANDTLPITVRHERIYILPTGRGLAFFAVVSIMLLASMNYRLNLGYALSFILVGLFASTLLSTYLNLVKLTIVSAAAKDSFAGLPLEFEVVLSEPGHRSRHSIDIASAASQDRIDIGKAKSATATLALSSPKRGIHSLGRITLSSDFPLGLWKGWGYVHAETKGYVYPQPEQPIQPFRSNLAGDLSGQKISEEREYKELRAYQVTDNPTSIAWKIVARGGDWYTKEFESPDSDGCEVDIKWSDMDNALPPEQRLSRMCAWLIEANKKTLPFYFQLPGTRQQTGNHGFKHQQYCLRQLAGFDTESNKT